MDTDPDHGFLLWFWRRRDRDDEEGEEAPKQ
jgi:hypothetical protein